MLGTRKGGGLEKRDSKKLTKVHAKSHNPLELSIKKIYLRPSLQAFRLDAKLGRRKRDSSAAAQA